MMDREDGLPAQRCLHGAAWLDSLVIFPGIIIQGLSAHCISFSCRYCWIKRLNNEVHNSHYSKGAGEAIQQISSHHP